MGLDKSVERDGVGGIERGRVGVAEGEYTMSQ